MSIIRSKKCESYCPHCGAGPECIEWKKNDEDWSPCLLGTCRKCGCDFEEIYEYARTSYVTPQEKTPDKAEIIVRVSDGMVQTVDFPDSLKNVVVVVKDYDTDGSDSEDIQEDEVGKYFCTQFGE